MKSQLGEKPLAVPIFALCAAVFAYRLYLSAEAWRDYTFNGIMTPALVVDTAHTVCALLLALASVFHLFIKNRRAHRNAVTAGFVIFCLCYFIYLFLNLVVLSAYSGLYRWTEYILPSLSLIVSSLLNPVPILFILLWASVRSAQRSAF